MEGKKAPVEIHQDYRISFPVNLLVLAKKIAKEDMRSFNSIVCLALREKLKRYEKEKKVAAV